MGLTVFDAGVIIGFIDRNDAHHVSADRARRDACSATAAPPAIRTGS